MVTRDHNMLIRGRFGQKYDTSCFGQQAAGLRHGRRLKCQLGPGGEQRFARSDTETCPDNQLGADPNQRSGVGIATLTSMVCMEAEADQVRLPINRPAGVFDVCAPGFLGELPKH